MDSKQKGPPSSEQQRRKYTTRACEQCRRRRAKCDGARPACSRCLSRGQSCQYPEGEDGRKPASKAYVDLLRRRIQALEQILRDHSIDIDASLATLSSSHPDLADAGSLTTNQEIQVDHDETDVEALCIAFEGALSIDEALNYEDDGEFRYFGPTSGRQHFLSDSIPEEAQDHSMPSQANCPASITINPRSEMNHRLLADHESGPLVSEELKSELTDLYFTWQNPWLLVIDEKLYRQSLETAGRYWSPLLENCILAVGCRFADNPEVRADPENTNSAGQLFFNRAEIYLSYELKFPSITTVQSLFLLSMLSVSTGADATSWLRQGMAKQISLDLGINLDTEKVSGSNMIPAEEIELRRLLYWSMYCDDKLAAAYTGRVCTLLDFQGLVVWPSVPTLEVDTLAVPGEARRPRMLILLLHALIRISHILEDIMLSLYMPKPRCQGNLRWAFFDSCCLKLKTWTYDLPPELRFDRLDDISLPQAFTLHMVYSTACILLARPFLATAGATVNSATESTGAVNTKPEEKYQRAGDLLHNSAKQICSTARKYRRVFGSFRRSPITATHCTLSAALVFLQDSRSRSSNNNSQLPSASSNTEDIKLCLTVLDELSTSWDTARRIRLNLIKLATNVCAAHIDFVNHLTELSKDQKDNAKGHLSIDPASLHTPGSPLGDPNYRNRQAMQYHPFGDDLQGSGYQYNKGPADAMSASLGFGLEQTLETMIGGQFAFGSDIMNDQFEWETFSQ